MTTTKHQAGVALIGFGLGMAVNLSFPEPLNVINPYLWLIVVIIGFALIIKT